MSNKFTLPFIEVARPVSNAFPPSPATIPERMALLPDPFSPWMKLNCNTKQRPHGQKKRPEANTKSSPHKHPKLTYRGAKNQLKLGVRHNVKHFDPLDSSRSADDSASL